MPGKGQAAALLLLFFYLPASGQETRGPSWELAIQTGPSIALQPEVLREAYLDRWHVDLSARYSFNRFHGIALSLSYQLFSPDPEGVLNSFSVRPAEMESFEIGGGRLHLFAAGVSLNPYFSPARFLTRFYGRIGAGVAFILCPKAEWKSRWLGKEAVNSKDSESGGGFCAKAGLGVRHELDDNLFLSVDAGVTGLFSGSSFSFSQMRSELESGKGHLVFISVGAGLHFRL
ncbi:MAG: hypothetical protein JXR49_22335 [Acidobacteria bacterium]|nr:hypothetical protein [Acidobacteriota bacterium]